MQDNLHLTSKGISQIISFKAAVNKGLPLKLANMFPNLSLYLRPLFTPNIHPLNPHWISGFTAGDGSFYVNLRASISAVYAFHLDIRDASVLHRIAEHFGFGKVSTSSGKGIINDSSHFKVGAIKDLTVLINHFDRYPLSLHGEGMKHQDFLVWKAIVEIIARKEHLTVKGREKVINLKDKLIRGF